MNSLKKMQIPQKHSNGLCLKSGHFTVGISLYFLLPENVIEELSQKKQVSGGIVTFEKRLPSRGVLIELGVPCLNQSWAC